MIALVTVLAEQKALGHKLNAFWFPGSLFIVGHTTSLGLDGHSLVVGGGNQVKLCRQAKGLAAQCNAAADGGRFIAGWRGGLASAVVVFVAWFLVGVGVCILFWIRQDVIEFIHAAVDISALLREGIISPSALDVHKVEQPGAVGILVEHANWQKVWDVSLRLIRGWLCIL